MLKKEMTFHQRPMACNAMTTPVTKKEKKKSLRTLSLIRPQLTPTILFPTQTLDSTRVNLLLPTFSISGITPSPGPRHSSPRVIIKRQLRMRRDIPE